MKTTLALIIRDEKKRHRYQLCPGDIIYNGLPAPRWGFALQQNKNVLALSNERRWFCGNVLRPRKEYKKDPDQQSSNFVRNDLPQESAEGLRESEMREGL